MLLLSICLCLFLTMGYVQASQPYCQAPSARRGPYEVYLFGPENNAALINPVLDTLPINLDTFIVDGKPFTCPCLANRPGTAVCVNGDFKSLHRGSASASLLYGVISCPFIDTPPQYLINSGDVLCTAYGATNFTNSIPNATAICPNIPNYPSSFLACRYDNLPDYDPCSYYGGSVMTPQRDASDIFYLTRSPIIANYTFQDAVKYCSPTTSVTVGSATINLTLTTALCVSGVSADDYSINATLLSNILIAFKQIPTGTILFVNGLAGLYVTLNGVNPPYQCGATGGQFTCYYRIYGQNYLDILTNL